MKRLIVVSLALIALTADVVGQAFSSNHSQRVSPEHRQRMSDAYFSHDQSATVRYQVGLDNTVENKVELLWIVKVPGVARPKYSSQYMSASFKPMAVTPSSGMSQQMYVMGWAERNSELVIERWTMRNAAVSTSVPAGSSAEPIIGFVEPNVVRQELYRGPGHYVYGCVFHPQTRDLIYLREDPGSSVTELMKFDVDAQGAVPQSIFTYGDIPFLSTSAGITLEVEGVTEDVYVFLWDNRPWVEQAPPLSEATASLDPSPYRTHVLIDSDADGLFETSYEDDYYDVRALFSSLVWDFAYEASSP